MNRILYIFALILIVIWALGFFGMHSFGGGNLIHILIVIAVIAILLQLIRDGGL